MTDLLILALAGALAGFINTLAGGGSLLALPALIFLGLPADVANATNRVGVVLQSVSASAEYLRAGRLDMKADRAILAATLAGAVVGVLLSLQLDAEGMQRLIGLAMLAMAPVVVFKPTAWMQAPEDPPELGLRHLALFFAIGLYGGLIQAGVGVFLLAALVLAAGREAVSANATKVLLVLLFTAPAVIIYAWSGLISWPHGLALALGSATGGWVGSRLSLKGGPKLIRAALLLVIAASGSKLLGLW